MHHARHLTTALVLWYAQTVECADKKRSWGKKMVDGEIRPGTSQKFILGKHVDVHFNLQWLPKVAV